jgi:uncharacterized protein YhbP (UPF0306 family)
MENYGNGEYVPRGVTVNRTQYGLHQEVVSIALGKNDERWEKAVFWVFDAPDLAFQPFEVFSDDFRGC